MGFLKRVASGVKNKASGLFVGAATGVLKAFAPGLIASALARIDETKVAEVLRPHLERVAASLEPQWKKVYAAVLRKVAEIAVAVADSIERR